MYNDGAHGHNDVYAHYDVVLSFPQCLADAPVTILE